MSEYAYPSYIGVARAAVVAREAARRAQPDAVIIDADGGIARLDPVTTADLEIHTADEALESGATYEVRFMSATATDVAYVRRGLWAAGAYAAGQEADNSDLPLLAGEIKELTMPEDGSVHHAISCLFPNATDTTFMSIMPITRVGDSAL